MSTMKQRADLRAALAELAKDWYAEEWVEAMLDTARTSSERQAEGIALDVIRSRRARRAWLAKSERRPGPTLRCAWCGREFEGSRQDQRTCSHACRQRVYRERVTAQRAS